MMILQCVESFTLADMDDNEEETGEAFTVQEGTVWRANITMEDWESIGRVDYLHQVGGYSLLIYLPFEYASCFREDKESAE